MKKYYYFNDPDNMGQNSIGVNNAPLIKGFTEISVDQLKDDENRLVAINICNIKTEEEFNQFCYIAGIRKERLHLLQYTQIEED